MAEKLATIEEIIEKIKKLQQLGILSASEIQSLPEFAVVKSIVMKHPAPSIDVISVLELLQKDKESDFAKLINIYNYGRMQGIRAERARRNRTNI